MGMGIWIIAAIVIFGVGFLLWGGGAVLAFVLGRRAKTEGGRRTGRIIGWIAAALAAVSLLVLIGCIVFLTIGVVN